METFSLPEFPIEVKHGSGFTLPIEYLDTDGEIIDLTDYTAKMQVRRSPEAEDEADIELTTENGGLIIDVEDGTITINITDAQTFALDENYEGTWDLFLIPLNSSAV